MSRWHRGNPANKHGSAIATCLVSYATAGQRAWLLISAVQAHFTESRMKIPNMCGWGAVLRVGQNPATVLHCRL